MQDRIYLLDLTDLLDDWKKGKLYRAVLAASDDDRLQRAGKLRNVTKAAQCLGAGLLQHYIWQRAAEDEKASDDKVCNVNVCDGKEDTGYLCLTVSELTAALNKNFLPEMPDIKYTEKGKPYFEKSSVFFSLSHSENFVLCAVSDTLVGADMERIREKSEAIAKRFFAAEENEKLKGTPEDSRALLFTQMWCAKEALGKMTGEGVIPALGVLTEIPDEGNERQKKNGKIKWISVEAPDGFVIRICKSIKE